MFSTNGAAAPDSHQARGWLDSWSRIRISPFWMVAIALFLRVGWIIVGHTYKFKSADNNFGFGWEMGRIGAAIASGHGFSNPFGPPTGPTAWEPPLYPYLIAVCFIFSASTRGRQLLCCSPSTAFSPRSPASRFFLSLAGFSLRKSQSAPPGRGFFFPMSCSGARAGSGRQVCRRCCSPQFSG